MISSVVTVVTTAEDIPIDKMHLITHPVDITNHDVYQFKNDPFSSGSIIAWGDNNWNQLNVPSPNSGFTAISAGGYHSLGLKADGSIVSWGANSYGQCDVPSPNSGFTAISAGEYHSLGLKADGSIVAWGDSDQGRCTVPLPNSGFTAISAGNQHSLGLKADGSIVAGGYNYYNQCDVPSPNSGFTAISAGGYHSLGLKADGSIVAWGDNSYGQCNVPLPNSGFTAISAGMYHSLGLKADGSIVAWGWEFHGICNVPSPNNGFTTISAGGYHSLGLKADGSIVAWGDPNHDQCTVPSPNSGFTAISAGEWYSLGLKPEGPSNNPPLFGNPSPTNGSTNNPPSFTWSIPINDPEGDKLSWTIQCSNGQTNSATDATNGTKSLSCSDLIYSTNYTIWVNATDPSGSGLYTRRWYTFTTEKLDQQQTQMKSNFALYTIRWGGQSFIPTVNTLPRVEVYIRKTGSPSSDIVLSIRSALTGADLVNISKPASQISTTSSWVEFDFSDLTVTPGSTYYLVLKTSGGNYMNFYYWGYGSRTPYTNGMRWSSFIGGIIWTRSPKFDFCFKTFGT